MQEAGWRCAHKARAEVEICGGGRRPLCPCWLLSSLVPYLPQQVGNADDIDDAHCPQKNQPTYIKLPFRSQLMEQSYQSMRSHLLERIGEDKSDLTDAHILETFHKCKTYKRIKIQLKKPMMHLCVALRYLQASYRTNDRIISTINSRIF